MSILFAQLGAAVGLWGGATVPQRQCGHCLFVHYIVDTFVLIFIYSTF